MHTYVKGVGVVGHHVDEELLGVPVEKRSQVWSVKTGGRKARGSRVISHGVKPSSGDAFYSPAFKSNLTNAYSRSFALRSY
jgi:hypothetical protein